ncbi:hypothetical protein EDC04DRAFT_2887466 [Pisolithus marmoratus]|nr:hypothetical protein EDC04DRAFT_2887466 [Pisolithus marmoratus]
MKQNLNPAQEAAMNEWLVLNSSMATPLHPRDLHAHAFEITVFEAEEAELAAKEAAEAEKAAQKKAEDDARTHWINQEIAI